MSEGGAILTMVKVLGYMITIGIVIAIIAVAAVAFLQPHGEDPQETANAAFRSVGGSVRSVLNRIRGQGQPVGRAIPGVNPPSIAERLTAISSASGSQNIVTPSQEVIMTGDTGHHSCLGAENEVMLEVKNDTEADQLDVSYSMESLSPSGDLADVIPARVVKVASCGAKSVVRQCIPLAPDGRAVRLHTLGYYYQQPVGKEAPILLEEKRVYPTLLDNETLKATAKLELNASAFMVPE